MCKFIIYLRVILLAGIVSSSNLLLAETIELKNPARQLQSINIDITTHLGDQQTFTENDVIAFLLTLEKDAYVTAVYLDAKGEIFQIIPNQSLSNHFYKAGLFIPIPPQDAEFNFKVRSPFGKETLWVFASDRPDPKLSGKTLKNGLRHLTQTIAEIRATINRQSKYLFGESKLEITTVSRE